MNYEQMNNNKCYLVGAIATTPIFSHEIYGENFYDTMLSIGRLSTQSDLIPITISDRLLSAYEIKVGDTIALKGQFRSYNKQEDNKSKLLLKVFVREIVEQLPDLSTNFIELSGFVCKQPIYRITPFKREICDVLLAVNRAYNKSDYLPCIAWGRNARFAKNIPVGEKIFVQGRIQSREYQKKHEDGSIENRMAYEISISKLSLDNSLFTLSDVTTTDFSTPNEMPINQDSTTPLDLPALASQ